MKTAQIHYNATGTPVSDQFDDVYFSNDDGLAETEYVFLSGNDLPERWTTGNSETFVIGETGFGTGLNFLASWAMFEQANTNRQDCTLSALKNSL